MPPHRGGSDGHGRGRGRGRGGSAGNYGRGRGGPVPAHTSSSAGRQQASGVSRRYNDGADTADAGAGDQSGAATQQQHEAGGIGGSPSSRQPDHHRAASVRRITQAEALAAAADAEATYEHHAYNDDAATLGASTIRTDDVGAVNDVARLYAICEAALPGPDDPPQSEMTPKQRAARESQLERTWEALREWLTAHPTDEERSVAGTHLGQFSTTALHLLCKLPDPPVDVVRGIISCEKEVASWQDSNGWIPLHHACANGACLEVLELLCRAFPGGKVAQDKRKRTSLHFAFFRSQAKWGKGGRGVVGSNRVLFGDEGQSNDDDGEDDMADIVDLLGDTGAARLPDENGMLPLHYGKFLFCFEYYHTDQNGRCSVPSSGLSPPSFHFGAFCLLTCTSFHYHGIYDRTSSFHLYSMCIWNHNRRPRGSDQSGTAIHFSQGAQGSNPAALGHGECASKCQPKRCQIPP